ncbi:hypothetical protein H9L21_08360 [Aeromicrobium senzhongii]|uniref:DUF2975 domain-containing protein n=1 Tax=Aeromicrobium senzhongii TaxID=2663859 RepID=A0ABX6SPH1_9ACTN|nr:hypothetical protein [Aeromicrobium senzhongii]MTB87021.1 hypothetical protein [Aeromicrobium senzhongii]QNL93157.1 hypothetical protein H9L21_08360 [Aeromicrobium senzhongii]
MTTRALRIGGRAALAAGLLAAAAAVTVAVIGILASAGKVTHPVDLAWGPFYLEHRVSLPVAWGADVCQSADVGDQTSPSECLRFFVHDADGSGARGPVREQDADVRPESATLTGAVELTSAGRPSAFVATSAVRDAIGLAVVSAALLVLWRLLAGAAGPVAERRTAPLVRALGCLLIAGSLVDAALGLFIATQLRYSYEAFGPGPLLSPADGRGFDLGQLALGGLVLLIGELFRRDATAEADDRLTV